MNPKKVGTILWHDLTVDNATGIGQFYQQVAGWQASPVDMNGYQDYAMQTPKGETVAGVCHKRGPNSSLPSQWLMYIGVEDLDASLQACEKLGGKRLSEIKQFSETQRYAIIEDPAGAVCALFEEQG